MRIRLILLDMDGTLLGRSQVAVSRRNMAALQRALRQGVTIVPCTGRVFDMLPPQILTQEGLRYFVTSHGARVYDSHADRDIYTDLIPPSAASTLLSMLEGQGLYNEIAAGGTIYLESQTEARMDHQPVPEHHLWYIRDHRYTTVSSPSAFFAEHGIGVEKMNLYGIPPALQQGLYDRLTATGLIAHTRPGAGPDLEFSHISLNKKTAVDALLETLGIRYDEVLALGDSSSDLPILRAAFIGVAMGNAPESIRQAADAVTAPNTQDGVAEALEKYL